eukprot:COSAG02_NODE_11387_length_1733_cov_8.089351_3_plen_35_part_01
MHARLQSRFGKTFCRCEVRCFEMPSGGGGGGGGGR